MSQEDLRGTVVHKVCMTCSREFSGDVSHCPHDGKTLFVPQSDQWLNKRLADKYQIRNKLGVGGMGEVYLAWHEYIETWVAIKFLKASLVEDSRAIKRFQQEAQAAKRLKHPNVIEIFDFDIAHTGQPYIVMEYLSGHDQAHPAISLAEMLKRRKSAQGVDVGLETILSIIAQSCDALSHAHRQGVIHRDIKPANIMIVPRPTDPFFVKVVDFGVAKLLPINNVDPGAQKLTTVGEICGSPAYMSPEQCAGEALDPRADIYSMGVVLYEAITGELPFLGRNVADTMQKHLHDAPKSFKEACPNSFVPDRMEPIVFRALQKQPHNRQQSMDQLAQEVRFGVPKPGHSGTLRAVSMSMSPALPPIEPPRPRRISWVWPTLCGCLITVLAGICAFTVWHQGAPQPHPAPAESQPREPSPSPSNVPAGESITNSAVNDTENIVQSEKTAHDTNRMPTQVKRLLPASQANQATAKTTGAAQKRPKTAKNAPIGRATSRVSIATQKQMLTKPTGGKLPALTSKQSQMRFSNLRD